MAQKVIKARREKTARPVILKRREEPLAASAETEPQTTSKGTVRSHKAQEQKRHGSKPGDIPDRAVVADRPEAQAQAAHPEAANSNNTAAGHIAPPLTGSRKQTKTKQARTTGKLADAQMDKPVKTPKNNTEHYVNMTPPKKEIEMTSNKNQYDKISQDMAGLGQENAETIMRLGNSFWKGYADYTQTCMSLTQSTMQKQMDWFKKAMSSKSVEEFGKIQSDAARQNLEDILSVTGKLSELGAKIATDCLEPVNSQISRNIKIAVGAAA